MQGVPGCVKMYAYPCTPHVVAQRGCRARGGARLQDMARRCRLHLEGPPAAIKAVPHRVLQMEGLCVRWRNT